MSLIYKKNNTHVSSVYITQVRLEIELELGYLLTELLRVARVENSPSNISYLGDVRAYTSHKSKHVC